MKPNQKPQAKPKSIESKLMQMGIAYTREADGTLKIKSQPITADGAPELRGPEEFGGEEDGNGHPNVAPAFEVQSRASRLQDRMRAKSKHKGAFAGEEIMDDLIAPHDEVELGDGDKDADDQDGIRGEAGDLEWLIDHAKQHLDAIHESLQSGQVERDVIENLISLEHYLDRFEDALTETETESAE